MKEIPIEVSINIQSLLQLEINKRWSWRSDSYWRKRIKSHVNSLRIFRKNNIYLKEK